MVQTCIRCGKNEVENSDLIFFYLPLKSDYPEWYSEIMKHLGIDDSEEILSNELQICEKHFRSDDIELEGNIVKLKENAIPILEEEESDIHLRPELVYYEEDVQVVKDGDNDGNDQHLVSLESLDEYGQDEDGYEFAVQEDIETEIVEDDDSQKILLCNDNNQIVNIVSSENNQYIQPIMPFYLSDSSIFTIMNENNEVGETIILQIENSEPQEEQSPQPVLPVRKVERDDFKVALIEKQLCKSDKDKIDRTYICDVCDCSFGCINCLKSHYETMHVANSNVVQYKCKYSVTHTKGLYCPVCELMFENRSDTLDHYITHAVACNICYSGFDRQMYLTEHMMTVHLTADPEAIYECELCKTEYHNSPSLTKHFQAIHKMILCYICKSRFQSIDQLLEHEKIHIKKLNVLPYACSKCNKAFAKISDIAVHIRQDHKKKLPDITSVSALSPISNLKKNVSELSRVYIVTKDDDIPRKKVKVKK